MASSSDNSDSIVYDSSDGEIIEESFETSNLNETLTPIKRKTIRRNILISSDSEIESPSDQNSQNTSVLIKKPMNEKKLSLANSTYRNRSTYDEGSDYTDADVYESHEDTEEIRNSPHKSSENKSSVDELISEDDNDKHDSNFNNSKNNENHSSYTEHSSKNKSRFKKESQKNYIITDSEDNSENDDDIDKSATNNSIIEEYSKISRRIERESLSNNERNTLQRNFRLRQSNLRKTISDNLDDSCNNFNSSISKKLSSTVSGEYINSLESFANVSLDSNRSNESAENIELKESSDSVKIISTTEPEIIDLSQLSPVKFVNSHQNGRNLIQDKITNYVVSSPVISNSEEFDSFRRQQINQASTKLESLKQELVTCLNLANTIGNKLPDNGSRMQDRIERLIKEIERQNKLVGELKEVKNEIDKSNDIKFKSSLSPPWPSANENGTKLNRVGEYAAAAIEEFEQHKVAALDCLKDICGSLETQPNEKALAEPPKGLKVTLMNHQRHALLWMNWREKQKPRGGILADDMGLGKTLTVISLILDSLQKADPEKENTSKKGNKGGTLVVCPASLIGQWKTEIERRLHPNLLTYCLHHGNNRDTRGRNLCKYDVVITTYNIVAREHKSQAAVFDIKWKRIVLDEAHVVRNHKNQSSIAVSDLRSKYRWALTGTPIHNKELDMFAVLKFLRCAPFDDLNNWRRWINKSAGGQQRLNMIMKTLLLRRTKAQLSLTGELQCLPEKKIELIEVELDKEEMRVYQNMLAFSQTLLAQFLHQQKERQANSDGLTYSRNYEVRGGAFCEVHKKVRAWNSNKIVKSHEILVLLLRLRQICCHPGLISAVLEDIEDRSQAEEFERESSEININILEQMEKLSINDKNGPSCMCSDIFHKIQEAGSGKTLHKDNPVFDLNRASSKIQKVLNILKDSVLRTNDKAVIISQWCGVLDIFKPHLLALGINFCSLTGSVPVKLRDDIVNTFNEINRGPRVMLLSLTAGGVGLNLVGANHLFLVDLHWNPQLEAQAQDRIFRVGQTKPVFIYKFFAKETVEERIRHLQDQKLALANSVLSGAKSNDWKTLGLEDIKSLFGLH